MKVGDLVVYTNKHPGIDERTGIVLALKELPEWMKKLGDHGEKIPRLYRGAKVRWSDGTLTEITHEKSLRVISKREV
mgnify:FL=1